MSTKENRSRTRSLVKVEPMIKDGIDIDSYITNTFDYVIKADLYNADSQNKPDDKDERDGQNEQTDHDHPDHPDHDHPDHPDQNGIYNIVRQIYADPESKMVRPIITLSPDIAISSATISGTAERHLVRSGVTHDLNGTKVEGVDFTSDLCVLFVGSKLYLQTGCVQSISDCQRSTMSNAMGLCGSFDNNHDDDNRNDHDYRTGSESFTQHRISITPSNVIYIVTDQIDDAEQAVLDMMHSKPMVFSLTDVRSKGIIRIMKYVGQKFYDKKIHAVLDLSALSVFLAPAANRSVRPDAEHTDPDTDPSGLNRSEVLEIMKYVALLNAESRLEAFDLTNYNFATAQYKDIAHPANLITTKIMLDVLKCIADFTERSINIFDESSKFLIWKKIPTVFDLFGEPDENKPAESFDPIGWYILRNIDIGTRSELIEWFEQLKKEDATEAADEADTANTSDIGHMLKQFEYPIQRFEIPDDHTMLDILISVTCPAEQNLKSYMTTGSYLDRCLVPGEKINMAFELLATPQAIQILNKEAAAIGEIDNFDDLDDLNKTQDTRTGVDENEDDAEYNSMLKTYNSLKSVNRG